MTLDNQNSNNIDRTERTVVVRIRFTMTSCFQGFLGKSGIRLDDYNYNRIQMQFINIHYSILFKGNSGKL